MKFFNRIVTHDGIFHADEVFAVAALSTEREKSLHLGMFEMVFTF